MNDSHRPPEVVSPSAARGQQPPVYFHLELLDSPGAPSYRGTIDQLLHTGVKAGQIFLLRVVLRELGLPEQRPVTIDSHVTLSLFPSSTEGGIYEAVTITNPHRRMGLEELSASPPEFSINISDNCPSGDLRFDLLVFDNRAQEPKLASILIVQIEGTHSLENRKFFDECHVELTASISDQTAMLYVQQPTSEWLTFVGFDRENKSLKAGPIKSMHVGLSDYIREKISPMDILTSVRRFSRNLPTKLLEWLSTLDDRHSDNFCLIICDHTETGTPWEMLEITDDLYLGAIGIIVRWIPIFYFQNRCELRVDSYQSKGRTIAYLSHENSPDAQLERTALDQLQTQYCTTVKELIAALSEPLSSVGLVYLGCHGMLACNQNHLDILRGKVALGSLANPTDRVIELSIEMVNHQGDPRPLVFANACNSAHMSLEGTTFYGWPEASLARFASGYLGTVGPVNSDFAASVAKRILQAARENDQGIRVPSILREIRIESIRSADKSSDASLERLLFSFMYVYYGNPNATISLSKLEALETG